MLLDSSNQFRNRLTFVEDWQWAFRLIEEDVVVVNTEHLVHRREDAAGRVWFRRRVLGARVGRADGLTHLQTAAAEDNAHRAGPVVSAGTTVDARGAAEFSEAHHQHVVEQAALMQVGDECRDRSVKFWQQVVFELREVVAVSIPAAAGLDCDVGHACFDQPSSKQAALSEVVAAVLIAELRVFFLDVERSHGAVVRDHVHRVAVERVETGDVSLRVDVAADRVELAHQALPAFKASQRHSAGKFEIADVEAILIRIAVGRERIEGRSEIRRLAKSQRVRQVDVGRQALGIRTLHASDDRTAGRINVVVDFDGRLIASQHPLRTHSVSGVRVRRRADDRQLVHDLRLQRTMLADFDAGDVGRNRLELTAKLGRSSRLQIVHVDMTWPTSLPDLNHGLASSRLRRRIRFRSQRIRERQATGGETTDAKKVTA